MDDAITGLRALVALVDAGDFTAAGEQLGVSRSAVSKAVLRLEQRLDQRLLERSSRSLRLTEEGERLLPHARRALDALAEVADALAPAIPAQVSGRVRLSLPPLFGRLRVLPVLHAVAQQHPQLQLDIGFSTHGSELVAEGVDLALRIGHVADRAELVARRLGNQPTALYAAPAYLQQRGLPTSREALTAHACLYPGADAGASQSLSLRDTAAQLEAALAGWGIAQLPVWLAEPHCREGRLQTVLADTAMPVLPIHLLWPRGRYLPRRVRVVIDGLLQALQD